MRTQHAAPSTDLHPNYTTNELFHVLHSNLRNRFWHFQFHSAIANEHGKKLVALEDSETTLPSAIFFRSGAPPAFGRAGINAYINGDEGRLMRSLKKILGTSLMEEKTLIGGRTVAFTEILQSFLSHLKEKADETAGRSIEHVVMGRPVHFHDDNDNADIRSQQTLESIAQKAGFKHIEFLFEPIAAAFAHEAKIEGEKLSLVIDLGGGTSDFTVIKIAKEKSAKADRRDDILATLGVRIGGTTFDYRFSLKSFMPELGLGTQYRDLFERSKLLHVPRGVYMQLSDWAFVNHAQTRKAISETIDIKRRSLAPDKLERLLKLQQNHMGHALLGEVEHTKIMLAKKQTHQSRFAKIDAEFVVETERASFENAIEADIERIFISIRDCLVQAQIEAKDINLVILTGGSTELPVINQMVSTMFPHATISQGDKMDSVGLGLAYRAGNIFKQ